MIEVWIKSDKVMVKGNIDWTDSETNRHIIDIMPPTQKIKVRLNKTEVYIPRAKIELIEAQRGTG